MGALRTIGHGTLPPDRFIALVQSAGIETIVDVRRYPGSRRHPQFRRDDMREWLAAAGVAYRWDERLGGRRRTAPDSPHVGLRDAAFRGYADHMGTDEFRAALDELVATTTDSTTSVMCAESLWWRCHRRLLADAVVLVKATPVEHVLPTGEVVPHSVTPATRLDERGRLVYDVRES
jgi:uncharacterized protein (DUF488 family)